MTDHYIDLRLTVTNKQADTILAALLTPTPTRIAIGEWEAECPTQVYPHMPAEEGEIQGWSAIANAIPETLR